MTKPDAKHELMAHWTQAWTTLGRWQALNARLSNEMAPQRSVSARRSPGIFNSRVVRVRASLSASLT